VTFVFGMYVCEAETEIWLIRTRDINFYGFFCYKTYVKQYGFNKKR